MTVVRAEAAATRPLRQRVLRPHQPPEELVYPGDEGALHFVVRDGAGTVVATASMYPEPEPEPGGAGPDAWRLRGMATAPEVRGTGLGAAVLRAALDGVRAAGAHVVWCNARTTAAGFYERHGFVRVGDEFDVPGIGPHYLMRLPLEP